MSETMFLRLVCHISEVWDSQGCETVFSFSREPEPRNCISIQGVSLLPDLNLSICCQGLFVMEGPRNRSIHGTGRVGLGTGLRSCLPLSVTAVRKRVDFYLLVLSPLPEEE